MSLRTVLTAAVACVPVLSCPALPVISEIYYHPPHGATSPEPVSAEWIELHNPESADVDVSGWSLSRGVAFTFPAGVTIPAGGYLVVAASPVAFLQARPDFAGAVTGGWTGQLSNSGEKVRLDNAAGTEVDAVTWSDEGDWALRGRGPTMTGWWGHLGWEWFSGADGGGKSVERITPLLRQNTGQIWADSQAAGGTPGAVNSMAAADVPPVILDAQHWPPVPNSSTPIRVSCEVADEAAAAPSVALWWRRDGQIVFTEVPMIRAGAGGEFRAEIPAQPHLTVIEYYITASDGTGSRSWPAPARTTTPTVVPAVFGQVCNALCQVDNSWNPGPATSGAMPVYRFVMTATERAELRLIQEGRDNPFNNNRITIDAAMAGAFLSTDGTGTEVRERCSVRNRGYTSRVGPPNNFSLAFVSGEEWKGMSSVQLNCRLPYAQVVAASIFKLAGVAVQEAAPAQFRVNGLNPAVSGQGVSVFSNTITYGMLARIEPLGSDWAARHFPEDADGNLYRVDDHDPGSSFNSDDFRYPGSSQPSSYSGIYKKQTNQERNDYTDIAALCQALNVVATEPVFTAGVRAQLNLEQWLSYFAADTLSGNTEGGLPTGRTDDFSMYRGITDRRFVLIPHDLDSTMTASDRSIFTYADVAGLTKMFNTPGIVHLYYRRLREICETFYTESGINALARQALGNEVPGSVITGMVSFVRQRRANVLGQIPMVNTFSAATIGTSTTTVDGLRMIPAGPTVISGKFDVSRVQSVQVNGIPATLSWRTGAGSWSLTVPNGTLFSLGWNRVTANYYSGQNGTGDIVFSSSAEVFYGSVTTTGRTVAANGDASVPSDSGLLWSRAFSPYLVSQNVTIPAGQTLTIEPGVRVYFSQGRRLTVNGTIRAEGTPHQRIRFTSIPGALAVGDADPIRNGVQSGAPKWGGVRIYDSMTDNVFRYCDFVNAQGTDPASAENYGSLGFIRSRGWADNLTFSGTHLRMLYGRNTTVTVTYCDFPDMFRMDTGLGRIEEPGDFLASADNRMEPLKIEYPVTDIELSGNTGAAGTFPDGLPRDGHFRVYYNEFHGNRGHQDVFDADSGRWAAPDPVTGRQTNGQFLLDCRHNTFHGITGDEHIDLGGDAYIASNRFYSGSKDRWTIDTGYANAISSGDKGSGTTIMVARNIFYDLDHAINCKASTAAIFEHNTCVDFHQDWTYSHTVTQQVQCGAVNLYVPNDGNAAGDGAWAGWNIFYGNSVAPDDTVSPDPAGGFPRLFSWPDRNLAGSFTSVLRIENNFIDDRILDTNIGSNHPGGLFDPAWGSGNVQGNPRFQSVAVRDFSLRVDSPARGTAPGGLDYGATVPEWAWLIPNVPRRTDRTDASITVGGPGLVGYRWRIDGGPWSDRVQIGDGGRMPRTGPILRQGIISLSGLAAGAHTVEVLGQDMAGNWQDADPARTVAGLPQRGPASFVWTIAPPEELVQLSEISASSDGADWVELHNPASTPADISGCLLTNAPGSVRSQTIPAGTVLQPGARMSFTLSAAAGLEVEGGGDSLYLMNQVLTVLDSISFGPQPRGYTLARTGSADAWGLAVPTMDAPNRAAPVSTDTSMVRISEVLASTGISFQQDWIVLHSSNPLPVLISGLVLSDNRQGSPGSIIPPLSFIGPRGAVKFLADDSPVAAGNHLTFALNSQQSSVALLAGGNVMDEMLLFTQADDVAQRRTTPDIPDITWATVPALSGGEPAVLNAVAIMRSLRISEIMFHAPEGQELDWIELRNTGSTTLNLDGVEFTQGVIFTFGAISLPPGQSIVVVRDLAAFRALYGDAVRVAGVYSGNLDNSGDWIEFRLPAPSRQIIQSFEYKDTWSPAADGGGSSLEMTQILLPDRSAPGRESSWAASHPAPSPGGVVRPILLAYPQWKNLHAVTGETQDADSDGMLPVLEYALGLLPIPGFSPSVPDIALEVSRSGPDTLLRLHLPANPQAGGNCGLPGVTYRIESGSDLTGWTTLATKAPDTGWTGDAAVSEGQAMAGYLPLTLTDPAHATTAPRYYRLAVSWIE